MPSFRRSLSAIAISIRARVNNRGIFMSQGKVAVITGASSGIGRAAAIGLGMAGYRVAILGRRQAAITETARLAGAAYEAVCDVTDPAAVHRFFADLVAKLGRVDVVFNNAGQRAPAISFGDLDVATWQSITDTNLNGAFYVAREAFRVMRDQHPQGGRIINNGSISAHVPRPGEAAYTASKAAITGLTKAISLDGRAFSIACGQIDIGNTATSMTADMSTGRVQANGTIMPEPSFDVKHVVDGLLYMAGLPLDANVQFMTVMATTMPYIGRG
jgi:NAD(P)-dependent dehydrogenase (short-subunit alcohol dehydrogenase family)